ncbi:MAG: hypothetical protein QXT67_04870 [Candidatus Bathyarchaeia archaeon]
MPDELKSVENCVRYILAHFPEARKNDKFLILTYWELVDKIPIPPNLKKLIIRKATNPETIRRTRQKIQSQKEYLPDQETLEKRMKLRKTFAEYGKRGAIIE